MAGAWLARAWAVLLAVLLALPAAFAQELIALPPLARVTDTTGTLTPAQREALDHKLAGFELAHGSQIAVVMLASTKPEPIEMFGNRLGEAWKLGRRAEGDGLLLIVARDDKRVRIEVARALEGAVPDAAAARIIRERLGPAFSKGDFYGGIDGALDAIFERIEAEGLTPGQGADGSGTAEPDVARRDLAGRAASDLAPLLLPMFLAGLIGGVVLKAIFGRFGALLAGSGVMAGALAAGLSLVLALAAGLFVLMLVLAIGSGRGGGGWGGGLPVVIGGGSSGSSGWSSGSGDGGGFSSGGGGDFSGGGASGSWD